MHTTRSVTPRSLTRRQALTWGAAALGAPLLAHAQGDKPLRMILPVSAGSGADGAMRAISNSLAKALGQPVVIENLPGAGGITGTAQIVRAPRDRSEEHTSELQSPLNLVCRLLLEKKKKKK